MKTPALLLFVFTAGVTLALQAQAEWLNKQLIEPESARIEWDGDPKPADLGRNGEHLYGYLVNFTVNARNRFGGYTGKQKHAVLIHNGEVIKGLGFGY